MSNTHGALSLGELAADASHLRYFLYKLSSLIIFIASASSFDVGYVFLVAA